MYSRTKAQQERAAEISDFVQETLSGMSVIRTFAREPEREEAFWALNQKYYRAAMDLAWTRSGLFRLMGTIGNLGVASGLRAGSS